MNKRSKRNKRTEILEGTFLYSGVFYELRVCEKTGEISYKKANNKCFIKTRIALVGEKFVDLDNNNTIGTVAKLGTCLELCQKIIQGKEFKVA